MTTEVVLLLAIYAFVLLGVFLGESGPISTFRKASPRLAARIERDISVGQEFKINGTGERAVPWYDPEN